MKKKDKYLKGFSMVEMLIVMGIFIILSVVGFNGFLSIRESFIARENVELIIQDIESTKLKAMNMEGGKDATWIYGFGIDLTEANELSESGDYQFFKWCSPVEDYGTSFTYSGNTYNGATQNVLPNLFEPQDTYLSGDGNLIECSIPFHFYENGKLPICYFNQCATNATGLVRTSEISTLLNREANQMEVLNLPGTTQFPAYLFFESLTGRAIIYCNGGVALGYEYRAAPVDEVVFNQDEIVPLDIVLHRKRSNKFDLITVYPISGEVIHRVYNENEFVNISLCDPASTNIMNYFKVGSFCYERYGIDDEINSFRN